MPRLTSQQILSAIGPSNPVAIQLDAIVPANMQAPVLAVAIAPGSNLAAVVEVTFDDPDVNGAYLSTATWFPITEWQTAGGSTNALGVIGAGASAPQNYNGAGYCPLFRNFSAVRVRVTAYVAGSLTMIVRQAYLPSLHVI